MQGAVAAVRENYGFIEPTTGGQHRFFHRGGMVDPDAFPELLVGDLVSFEEEPSSRGPRARLVALVRTA